MSEISTLWEAHKAFFRGKCISLGFRLKRDAVKLKAELISQLRAAEMSLLHFPTVKHLRVVVPFWNRIKSMDFNKISKSLLWSRQKFYEYTNKPHRMLVNRPKPRPFLSIPDHLMQLNSTPLIVFIPCLRCSRISIKIFIIVWAQILPHISHKVKLTTLCHLYNCLRYPVNNVLNLICLLRPRKLLK